MALPLLNSWRLSFYQGTGLRPDRFVGFRELRSSCLRTPSGATASSMRCATPSSFSPSTCWCRTRWACSSRCCSPPVSRAAASLRTIIFVPATLSVLVIGFLWRLILNPQWGAINKILTRIGLEQFAQPWLGDPEYRPDRHLAGVGLAVGWPADHDVPGRPADHPGGVDRGRPRRRRQSPGRSSGASSSRCCCR